MEILISDNFKKEIRKKIGNINNGALRLDFPFDNFYVSKDKNSRTDMVYIFVAGELVDNKENIYLFGNL